ncbi:MAG: hypothetical protein LIR46_14220 [Bacteroidota bacterium]|nr:hypothetical protein [Bacteroidota bacterium]
MSNPKYFKKCYVKSVMSKINPFYQRQRNNPDEYMLFNQVKDAYYNVMTLFFINCPQGYIELPYILSLIYPEKPFSIVKAMAIAMTKYGVGWVSVIVYDSKEGELFFETFFLALHTLCDTTMDRQAFKDALVYSKHLKDVLNVDNRDDE